MKIRRLQRLNSAQEWEDHGYIYELENGRCTFRFNSLVWESTGSRLNARLYESGAKLEEVQGIIPASYRLRWFDIEEIEGEPEEIKAVLDEACKIPRAVSIVNPITTRLSLE